MCRCFPNTFFYFGQTVATSWHALTEVTTLCATGFRFCHTCRHLWAGGVMKSSLCHVTGTSQGSKDSARHNSWREKRKKEKKNTASYPDKQGSVRMSACCCVNFLGNNIIKLNILTIPIGCRCLTLCGKSVQKSSDPNARMRIIHCKLMDYSCMHHA